ncbi:hypothetical protein OIU74_005365 [Salix koriyanagi]|uniref:Uncharacterized protein n=1 Tax=Salix koriyanagi TaxID=2511006 RepID=A0A9Q0ZGE6_9ROSI|nr:hypothetical protein OIU74_005365 [Salix koriyanagi]
MEDYYPVICFLDCVQVCCYHGKFQGSGCCWKIKSLECLLKVSCCHDLLAGRVCS